MSISTNSKILLIGKIKGLAEEAKHTRKLLLKNRHKEFNGVPLVNMYAITKNIIGEEIRHHLLAYAFMRGESYHKLEKKCRDDNRPDPSLIHKIVLVQDTPFTQLMDHSLEDIMSWIKGV